MITHRIAIAGTAVLLALAGLGAPGRSHATGGGDAREIARLVERLSANYRDAIGVSMAHIIERGQAVTLGESFTLVARYDQCVGCSKEFSFWDKGLMKRAPLTLVKASSIRIWRPPASSESPRPPCVLLDYEGDPEKSSGFRTMACRNPAACEQMVADLKRLVEIAHGAGAAGGRTGSGSPYDAWQVEPKGGARATIPGGACERVVGEWSWFDNGTVTFTTDRKAVWRSPLTGSVGHTATWQCDTRTGALTLPWTNGFTDVMKLTSDGRHLQGRNNRGMTIWAQRRAPEENSTDAGTSTPAKERPPGSGGPGATTGKGTVRTPQAEVDAQGNVKVPGLGMTFAPNGDIYGSDGTKLYDGATQRWLNQGGAAPTAPSPAPVSK